MAFLDSNAISVLLGVVSGGLLTAGTTLFFEWYRDARDSRRLAQAFRGEIKALQTIVEKRKYIELLRTLIATITATQRSENVVIRVRREYFKVYDANVERIGLLRDPLPELIAAFYVMGNSILEDLDALDDGLWHDKGPEQQLSLYTDLLHLFEDTVSAARKIVATIDEVYS